ncbi:hypothetical protein Rhe02_39610 [Rhizocola hellebori]|uniref:Uncharacterized protein n=1 Tax=Rhizocola hellebori TaxID=1392758 RepID=A0A8J3Q8B7_9ACTN|nr:hypothetical protein [Rhizocola hellebori]GIH05894.1 hypothetical protein Rhe02_39610 [Rhizocola hellebori]
MTTSEHGPKQVNSLLEPVPSLVLDGFDEPSFNGSGWLDGHSSSLVDHPLLRGLLLELPPKGSQPSPEWMNRWFEAARAVLDLIYNPRR